ncbi:MAG TPA: 50S ribosomal protein L29 [Planktothrix sp.]|jgi:large subunit ribosomal protein L29
MKLREMRELNSEELKTKIDDTRKEIVELRFTFAMRKLESPAKLSNSKKTLARLLTIQTEKNNESKASAPSSK